MGQSFDLGRLTELRQIAPLNLLWSATGGFYILRDICTYEWYGYIVSHEGALNIQPLTQPMYNVQLLSRRKNLVFVTDLPADSSDHRALAVGYAYDWILGLHGFALTGLSRNIGVHTFYVLPMGGCLTEPTANIVHSHLQRDLTPGRPKYLIGPTCIAPDTFYTGAQVHAFMEKHDTQYPNSLVIVVVSSGRMADLLGLSHECMPRPGTILTNGLFVDRDVRTT